MFWVVIFFISTRGIVWMEKGLVGAWAGIAGHSGDHGGREVFDNMAVQWPGKRSG